MTKSLSNNSLTKTEISLRDYFEDKFLASDKALILAFESLKIRLESIDKATEVAKISMEKRLDQMNEIRGQLKDQANTFVTKTEHDFILSDIRELRESRAELSGKANSSSVIVSYVLSAIALAIALIHLFR